MIKYRIALTLIINVLLTSNCLLPAQPNLYDIHRTLARDLDLEGSMRILNLSEEQPETIEEIYKTAFQKFSCDPDFSFSDLSHDTGFVSLCRKNGILATGGPMLGDVTPYGIKVWLRTLVPANVTVRVYDQGDIMSFGPVKSTEESDLTAIVPLTGLKPETNYTYQVYIDGKPLSIENRTSFSTSPEDKTSGKMSIAFGSCFHRWGLSNEELIGTIRSRKPIALLANGDVAAQDRRDNTALHRADYLLRDFQNVWSKLVSTIPVYTTWDDHDYFDNDLFNIPEGYTRKDKEDVWSVYRDAWNNPAYGFGEEGQGVFFRTRIGPADVIMLDNRYFRKEGNYLGSEQMKWLEEKLLDCKGPFIILSNPTMWSDYVSDGKDSWGVYDPEGREKIFNLIEKNQIAGVLLISGDRHGARGFKIPRPSGFTFYEFGAASLGGRVGPLPIKAEWQDHQLYGISGEYAFGEFSFNTDLEDPEVTFRLIHEDGTTLYEYTLKRSELTPGHNPNLQSSLSK